VSNTIPFAVIGLSAIGAGVIFTRSRLQPKRTRIPAGVRADELFLGKKSKAKYPRGSHCDHTLLPSRLGSGAIDVKLTQYPIAEGRVPWTMNYKFANGWGASVICYDDSRPLVEHGENRFQMIPIEPSGPLYHSGEVNGDAAKIAEALREVATWSGEYGVRDSDESPDSPLPGFRDEDWDSLTNFVPDPKRAKEEVEFPWTDIPDYANRTNPGFNPLVGLGVLSLLALVAA
jgi:hypothetical protein